MAEAWHRDGNANLHLTPDDAARQEPSAALRFRWCSVTVAARDYKSSTRSIRHKALDSLHIQPYFRIVVWILRCQRSFDKVK
jgi:hypothetical protein